MGNSSITPRSRMNNFTSWEALETYAECAAATGIITQFTKRLFSKLPTQWLSYIIAVVIMGLATVFTAGLSWSTLALYAVMRKWGFVAA